jgi:hypothetical protein
MMTVAVALELVIGMVACVHWFTRTSPPERAAVRHRIWPRAMPVARRAEHHSLSDRNRPVRVTAP